MGVIRDLTDDYGGDLEVAIAGDETHDGMIELGCGQLLMDPGAYSIGEIDFTALPNDLELCGKAGPGHTVITGPTDHNTFAYASSPNGKLILKGLMVNGPTTAGFVTLYGIDSKAIHLVDTILTGGGNGATIWINVGGVWIGQGSQIRDVPGVAGNNTPIGLWLFGGTGNDYLMIPDLIIEEIDGSGFVIDAGSADPEVALSTIGGSIGNLKLINTAQHASAAGAIDIQSGVLTQFGNVLIDGIASGPAALSIKEDQYYGSAGVYKPRGIQVANLVLRNIPGVGAYLSGAQDCQIGNYVAENVDGYLARFVAGAGGGGEGGGGGSDHTCHGNVIGHLDWKLSPDTTGVNYDSTSVTANVIRNVYPDALPKVFSNSASQTGRSRNKALAY